jgi:hypothetical protein
LTAHPSHFKEAARMNHVKAIAYKLVVFTLAIYVVYKLSVKDTHKEAG